jgi:hypothetical protein
MKSTETTVFRDPHKFILNTRRFRITGGAPHNEIHTDGIELWDEFEFCNPWKCLNLYSEGRHELYINNNKTIP